MRRAPTIARRCLSSCRRCRPSRAVPASSCRSSIALGAIRDAADRSAPRNFGGKADNPVSQILQNADIGWTASRGPITATGAQDALSLVTPITGTLNVTGSLSAKATGAIGDALGGLLGDNVAKQIGSVNIKNLNASAEIKGNVAITARPKIAANWRIDPNLAAQVNLGDTSLSVAGARINVPAQVKPVIDKTVADQIGALAGADSATILPSSVMRGRNGQDSAARFRCKRGILRRALPSLWLEMKPTRALAAQPRDRCVRGDADDRYRGRDPHHAGADQARMPVSVDDRTSCRRPRDRSSSACRSTCPLPRSTRSSRRSLRGETFPEDGSGSVDVTVKRATVAASGDRLLISLLVNAKEKKSFFGFGGEATVHIWGRPVLDQAQQTLRLTDIELAVESEAAFGLLGRGGARGDASSAEGAGGEGDDRPQAVRRERAEEDRRRDRRFPEERGRRAGRPPRSPVCAWPASPSIPRRCASSPRPRARSTSTSPRCRRCDLSNWRKPPRMHLEQRIGICLAFPSRRG